MGCGCTWQRPISLETNTGATEEIPALNQCWGGCNYPTSNWPHKSHQVPYLVPGPPDHLSPLWSDTDYWPYAPRVCSVTGKSWRIQHRWLIEYSIWDISWDLHCGIPATSGILLISTVRHSIQYLTWTIPKLMHSFNFMNATQLTPWQPSSRWSPGPAW